MFKKMYICLVNFVNTLKIIFIMKHLFLFVAFVCLSFGANAQACNKTASNGKACCAKAGATKVASAVMEADAAVEASKGSITKRTCEVSGTASYFQKSVCSTSGSVSWDEVKYDASAKKFTKVASASMEKDANGKAVTTQACTKETKACSKTAGGKACCAKPTKQGTK
jgi:hypothetical protein